MAQDVKVTAPVRKEIADYIERAKRAQEQRRTVSDAAVTTRVKVPQKELIRKFAPECVGPKATFHAMFGDRKLTDQYVDEGYEPVLFRGEQVQYQGDLLWRLPIDLHQQNMKANVALSEQMLGERMADDASEAKASQGVINETSKVLKPGSAEYAAAEKGVIPE